MKLYLKGMRHLPGSAALSLMLLAAPLALGAGGSSAFAQQSGAAASGAAGGSMPMGQPLGASSAAPMQRPVNAARQATGPGATPEPMQAQASTDAGQAADAAGANAGEPQPMNSLATVGADYKIGPSDLLDFDVYGVPDMQRTVRVNASGVVSLPLIGPVMLAGLTTAQAENMIATKYAQDFLQNPQVSLFIKEFTTQRITIEGAVAKPGIYPVTGQLTLLRALALAGGGAQFALLNEVMLFRAGSAPDAGTQTFDLDKIRNGEIPDPVINSDDVIVVKRDPKRTALRDSLFGDVLNTLNPFK